MESEIKKGLVGVIVDETKISNTNVEEKKLYYRGYSVDELAETCAFEEVAYLIWNSELPNKEQLAEFSKKERALRKLPDSLISLLELFPKTAHPMDTLRTAISFLGSIENETDNDKIKLSLLAKIPGIIAATHRLQNGLTVVEPRSDLSFAENFFHLFFEKVPDAEIVKAFNLTLTLYAEHTFNSSTFTARCIASSLSDMYAAITGGVASLKGPLHGGANEAVMYMLKEVDMLKNVKPWLENALAKKELVMGFGHRLYKYGDSRVPCMKRNRDLVAKLTNNEALVELSNELERLMQEKKGILPNLDFPAGPTFYMMGFPIPVFTPIFVMARITGWTAHVIEQLADNKLIRPSSVYLGAKNRQFIPLEKR